MKTYLFLFSIGSVQSFIAQARKTQDFAAGSAIISYLINHAMETLERYQSSHPDFIFPQEHLKTKPHRFLALIEEADNPKKVGEHIENAVRKKFQNLAEQVLQQKRIAIIEEAMCKKLQNRDEQPSQTSFLLNQEWPDYYEQIEHFLDIHWVMLPFEPGKDDYKTCYRRIEQALGQTKNIRQFKQLKECGRKCALDGSLNVKVYRKTQEEQQEKRRNVCQRKLFASDTNNVLIIDYDVTKPSLRDIQPGEGLSAVSFTKRCVSLLPGMTEGRKEFPSTAEICLMKTLDKIKNDRLYNDYKSRFGKNFDAQLLYEENLNETYFKKYGYAEFSDTLDEIQKHHKALQEKVKTTPKYYALIRFDGDNMGKWLSGSDEYLTENSDLLAFHKALSEKLGMFANWTRTYLKSPDGQTVYAGGDDFLGFVNLESLFPVLQKLHEKFYTQVHQSLFDDKKNNTQFLLKRQDTRLTFSVGVVIAHYKIPLSEVITWSTRMEKEAKEVAGKNALGIAVLKHSGEITKTVWAWRLLWNDEGKNVIHDMMEKLKKDSNQPAKFSNTFITGLSLAFSRLMDKNGKYDNHHIVETELKRLLRRSCNSPKPPYMKQKDYDMKVGITPLTKHVIKMFKETRYENSSFNNFLSLFHIADFIARKTNEGI